MKRIILTEQQYRRLVRQNLTEQKVVFNNPEDEKDVSSEMMQLITHLEYFLDTIANKPIYIQKVEDGIVYIDSSKYTKEEKDLINIEIDRWVSFTNISNDKKEGDLAYNFGTDTDWVDLHPEDIAVVDNENNSATDDVDNENSDTAEVEEEITYDVADVKACKWGKNSKNIDRTVVFPPDEDIQFYKDILKGIGANVTCEKMLFFFAWRSGESSDSTYNPFATTYRDEANEGCYFNCLPKGGSGKTVSYCNTNKSCRSCPSGCVGGVRNYNTKVAGIRATVNTLKNGHYPNLLSKLKTDSTTATDLANETSELSVWGTGSLPKQILQLNKTLKPRRIAKPEGEIIDCTLTTSQEKLFNDNILTNEDNLNFRYWVNSDNSRLTKVNNRLSECGLSDPKLDQVGSINDHLRISFALLGQKWIDAGKPARVVSNEEETEVEYSSDTLLTYSTRAKKDLDNGIINPKLISDIIKALKSINMSGTITTARTGHNRLTVNGNISTHWAGNGVDLAILNGVGNPDGKKSNGGVGNANFMADGDRLVAALQTLGYKFGEGSNKKSYLWRTSIGGNHFNHIHVSNRNR